MIKQVTANCTRAGPGVESISRSNPGGATSPRHPSPRPTFAQTVLLHRHWSPEGRLHRLQAKSSSPACHQSRRTFPRAGKSMVSTHRCGETPEAPGGSRKVPGGAEEAMMSQFHCLVSIWEALCRNAHQTEYATFTMVRATRTFCEMKQNVVLVVREFENDLFSRCVFQQLFTTPMK